MHSAPGVMLLILLLGAAPIASSEEGIGECYRLDLEVAHNVLFDWAAQQGTLREALRGVFTIEESEDSESYDAHPATVGWHGVIPLLRIPVGLFPLAEARDEVIVQFVPEGDRLCVEAVRLANDWDGGELFAQARIWGLTAQTGELLLIPGARFPLSPEDWERLRFEENRTKFISVLACRGNDGGLVFLGLDYVGALPERPERWK